MGAVAEWQSRKLFGTDGIRGKPGEEPLTHETIVRITVAFVRFLRKSSGRENLSVVIGKDTRASCGMIEKALVSGLISSGVDVSLIGVIPTGGVAYLTRAGRFSGGILISASHNPGEENGIKFFSSAGEKLSELEEETIEQVLSTSAAASQAEKEGNVVTLASAAEDYKNFLMKATGNPTLNGLRLVVDTANGAAHEVAEDVFKTLGAAVTMIGNKPDGMNINKDCGTLYPQQLQREVVRNHADCGIAFDGDADRVVVVDEKGNVVGGDALILALAKHLLRRNKLNRKAVVVTEYTNTAFDDELSQLGVKVARVKTGDRYVYEEMKKNGYSLGGEQSGHIILGGNTTGDGILTALNVLAMMKESGKQLSELTRLEKKGQILINVEVKEKKELSALPLTSAAIKNAEKRLVQLRGRHLIRYSGTQNMLRIMLEGNDKEEIKRLAETIAAAARNELD